MQRGVKRHKSALICVIFVIGFLLIYSSWFEAFYHSIVDKFANQRADHFDNHLSQSRLILILSSVIGLVVYLGHSFILEHKLIMIKGFIALQLLVIAVYAYQAPFGMDGFEHLHSSWNVLHGHQPFTDFFQHHHPLLWYIHAPIVGLSGEGVWTLWLIRVECFLIIIGLLWIINQIGKVIGLGAFESYFAMTIFLSNSVIVKTLLTFRPDLLQTFFCLISFLFLLKFLSQQKNKYLIYSGVLWAIGFLFLQKALFVLAPMGIILVILTVSRKVRFRSLLLFIFSIGITVLTFFGVFLWSNSLQDYLLFNWVINFYKEATFLWWEPFVNKSKLAVNSFSYLMTILGIIWFLMKWRSQTLYIKVVLYVALGAFILMAITPRPYPHYYILCFVLLSLVVVGFIRVRWIKSFNRVALSIALPMMLLPLLLIIFMVPSDSNLQSEIKLIRFVDQNSDADDFVWDIDAGIFRPDMHYFWYHFKIEGLTNNYTHYQTVRESGKYDYLIGKPKDDFDFCRLMEDKKPTLFIEREYAPYKLSDCKGVISQYEIIGTASGLV